LTSTISLKVTGLRDGIGMSEGLGFTTGSRALEWRKQLRNVLRQTDAFLGINDDIAVKILVNFGMMKRRPSRVSEPRDLLSDLES
jgi:hypothetical protein